MSWNNRKVAPHIGVHRFAVILACCAFLLVIAGGLVTSTGSGLSVPDWPLSYGQLMPPMTGGVFYEHGHRMVATFVGLLTTILAFWLWRVDSRPWVRGLGGIALLAIIVQGVLGGLTVLFQLPTPISVAHAALAQSFFSLTVVLALVTSPGWWQTAPAKSVTIETTRLYALWTTGVIFLQLVLGAWMRHSNAGLAIPDFPLSYGKLVPPFGLTGLAGINQMRSALSLTSVHLGQVWINFAHRAGALAVLVMSIVTTIHVLRRYRSEQRLREPAIIFQLLVIFQVAFGALTVWTGKGVEVTTIHVATGALVLAASVLLSVRTFQIYKSSDAFIPAPDHRRAGEPRTLVEGRLGTMAGG